ncbi:hypothetical protein PR002_g3525 [Phytophthora rubi]|uniref:Uncharacterized protein n=1 Tax=Phytophthora rubi TaxID=129364 RepID=A0A6A3NCD8_9STRA|nr:hypothetical protein PR002_g3525 [Phytophthora rubi]
MDVNSKRSAYVVIEDGVLAEELGQNLQEVKATLRVTPKISLPNAVKIHDYGRPNFLVAITLYPHGPWRKVAAYVGTRSIRQVQTDAQKYHEKVMRRMRGLHKGRRSSSRKEHRIDDDLLSACFDGVRGVLEPTHSFLGLQATRFDQYSYTQRVSAIPAYA